jgi:hypothetical protein
VYLLIHGKNYRKNTVYLLIHGKNKIKLYDWSTHAVPSCGRLAMKETTVKDPRGA